MKTRSLETLLRLAQRKMDALGAEAAASVERIQSLERQIGDVGAAERKEVAAVAGRLDVSTQFLPAYRGRMRERAAGLRAEIEAEQSRLADIRVRLMEAYREKAKFEQLIDSANEKADTLRRTREQADLDEVAVTRVRRL